MQEDEVLNAVNQFNKIRLDIEKLIFSLEKLDCARNYQIRYFLFNLDEDFKKIKKHSQIILNILKKYNVKSINDLWEFYKDEFHKFSSKYNHNEYRGIHYKEVSSLIYDGEKILDNFRCWIDEDND